MITSVPAKHQIGSGSKQLLKGIGGDEIMPQLHDPLPILSIISDELGNYSLEGDRGSEMKGEGNKM